jgi:hypothetical protein
MEFYEWITEITHIPFNKRNDKKEFYSEFLNEYQDFKRWLTARRFTIWIQKYASFKGIEYKDGVTNGQQWFELVNPDVETKEDEIEF